MSLLGFHLGAGSAGYKHNLEALAQTRAVAHLVGCSSCKDGKGILPFVEYTIPDSQILDSSFAVCNLTRESRGRPMVHLHLAGAPETSLAELESVLLKAINVFRKTR